MQRSHFRRTLSLKRDADKFARARVEQFKELCHRHNEKEPVEGRCSSCSPQNSCHKAHRRRRDDQSYSPRLKENEAEGVHPQVV